MVLRNNEGEEPARYMGPRRTAVNMGWPDHADETSFNQQLRNLKPFFFELSKGQQINPLLP